MITDVSKSSSDQLWDAIVAANTGTIGSLTKAKVSFGSPVAGTGAREADIPVNAVANSGVSGSVVVQLDRLNVTDFEDAGQITLTLGATPSKADVLAAFNVAVGADLTEADDVDFAAMATPTADDDGDEYTIITKATSLAYRGSVTVTLSLSSVPLSSFITNTDLGALTLE